MLNLQDLQHFDKEMKRIFKFWSGKANHISFLAYYFNVPYEKIAIFVDKCSVDDFYPENFNQLVVREFLIRTGRL